MILRNKPRPLSNHANGSLDKNNGHSRGHGQAFNFNQSLWYKLVVRLCRCKTAQCSILRIFTVETLTLWEPPFFSFAERLTFLGGEQVCVL